MTPNNSIGLGIAPSPFFNTDGDIVHEIRLS